MKKENARPSKAESSAVEQRQFTRKSGKQSHDQFFLLGGI